MARNRFAPTFFTEPNKGTLFLVNTNKNGKPVAMVEVFAATCITEPNKRYFVPS